jgi:hypothetical protein
VIVPEVDLPPTHQPSRGSGGLLLGRHGKWPRRPAFHLVFQEVRSFRTKETPPSGHRKLISRDMGNSRPRSRGVGVIHRVSCGDRDHVGEGTRSCRGLAGSGLLYRRRGPIILGSPDETDQLRSNSLARAPLADCLDANRVETELDTVVRHACGSPADSARDIPSMVRNACCFQEQLGSLTRQDCEVRTVCCTIANLVWVSESLI